MERSDVIRLLVFYRDYEREISFIERLEPTEEDAAQAVTVMREVQQEISAAMKSLDYTEKDIVFSKYVQGEKWQRIRAKHHYSDRQARNIGNQALNKMAKRLDGCPCVEVFLREKTLCDTSNAPEGKSGGSGFLSL